MGAVTLLGVAPIPARHLPGAGVPGPRAVQFRPGAVRDLAPGRLLVASRDVIDPNFHEAVVLLIDYDAKGAMGLIINRRTKAPMSQVLPDLHASVSTSRPVFFGGPVEAGGLALVRSEQPPEDGRHVLADVYLLSTRPGLEAQVSGGAGPDRFRVFIGYSGWRAGQLETETIHGLWHVLDGDAGLVFDADPDSLWRREIPRADERSVQRFVPGRLRRWTRVDPRV
jgi:putative transcriptional regulator